MIRTYITILTISFSFIATSCNKETTCTCQTYIVEEDGSRIADGPPNDRVLESRDADCSNLENYQDNQVGNDREVRCTDGASD